MSEVAKTSRRKWLLFAPLGVAAGCGVGFYAMLNGMRTGSFDPRGVPSTLVGRPVPDFSLPAMEGIDKPALAAADLRGLGRAAVVNFWASWCVPCIVEHPQLMRLARQGVPVFGVNYKDQLPGAQAFLTRHGNPFTRLGVDAPGRVAIDWGVYGVPETYFLDKEGLVRWRWAGPITPEVFDQDLTPLLRRYA
ncbi:DsbE family thiol:disulfide interchange protein [Plastoroseomonas arctica]|uniref:DsbE family thiol:disulfide interchange protein n=1 Tax=Plastoroseomonas arctica TaxID=1509237 RepID=A0AAF1JVK8_9PROT|nr:DsbE family thiol:disulfide interchange protein [Plastoroseomonas arctica]MBR0654107.1 DsbE family thiol:disulfide interchange protein [Plastoroseomonas arctica]